MTASRATWRSSEVAVTGVGIVSAAGRGWDETCRALIEGRSGLGPLTLFDSPRCGMLPVAEVRGVTERPRVFALGRLALEEIRDRPLPPGAGLAVGTTVAGMPESEEQAARLLRGQPVDEEVWTRHDCASVTDRLAREFRLAGPRLTVSNACASGAEAIACAAELVASGEVDAMVAGGVDALCRLTLNGFASLLAVDPEGCRPFDRDRAGMSLGEGAAWLVLERLDATDRPLAILAGHGNSCDAHHATAPEPDGRGAEAAIRSALAAVDGEVDYVNAHGTGTPANDRAESLALRRVFGDVPPFSSTKRIFGHALGAAGAIEAAVAVMSIREGFLPGNPGFRTPDPECGIRPLSRTRSARPRVVISNSFGFGGNNTVLCFRECS